MIQRGDMPTFSQLPYASEVRRDGQHFVVDGVTGNLIKGGQRILTSYTISPRTENVSYQTSSVLPRIKMDPSSIKDKQKYVSSYDTIERKNYTMEEGRGPIVVGGTGIAGGTTNIIGGVGSGIGGVGQATTSGVAQGSGVGGINTRTVIYNSSGFPSTEQGEAGRSFVVGPTGISPAIGQTNSYLIGAGPATYTQNSSGLAPTGNNNAYAANTGTSYIVGGGVSGVGSGNLGPSGIQSQGGTQKIPIIGSNLQPSTKPAPYSVIVPPGNGSSIPNNKFGSLIEPDQKGTVPPEYKLRRDDESPSKQVVWGKLNEEDREAAAQSRRIETYAAKNESAGNSLFKDDEVSEKSRKCQVCSCANCPSCQNCIGNCRKCQCGAIPKWLIYLLLALILLSLLLVGGYFIYKLFPHSLLPSGYQCPQPYFENGTQCLKCPSESTWNGTVCLKSDNTAIAALSTEPVKIDPTIAHYKIIKTNVTSKDQCASDEIFYDKSCLKCPSGSNWNGTHCYVPPPPGPQSKTAIAEAVCKVGEFLKGGKCLKCPAGTVWNGDHCVRKVIMTQTQDELLSPVQAHNSQKHLLRNS